MQPEIRTLKFGQAFASTSNKKLYAYFSGSRSLVFTVRSLLANCNFVADFLSDHLANSPTV
jgi:hypothetical protein